MKSDILLLRRLSIALAIVVAATASVLSPLAWSDAHAQVPDQTWSVRVDEPTLTRDMNAWADAQPPFDTPLGSARLQGLSVQLGADHVQVQGNAEMRGISAPFSLSGDASVDSGRVLVHLRTAQVAGVDVPGGVRNEIEQRLQDLIDQSTRSLRVTVQSVSVADGALVVQGNW